MNYAKQATKKMCELPFYNFLNGYSFNMKMKQDFENYFINELNGEVKNRNPTWIVHRNFLFVLAYKNGYSTTFLGSMYGHKSCNVVHNIRVLTERMDVNDTLTITAKENVMKFLSTQINRLRGNYKIKSYCETGDLIESMEEFNIFNNFLFDLETFLLFKKNLNVKFSSRKEPQIFYRYFLIVVAYKEFQSLNKVGVLFDIDHATVINSINRICNYVKNKDEKIMSIYEDVKMFFYKNGKIKTIRHAI
jgi:hypothetical protein